MSDVAPEEFVRQVIRLISEWRRIDPGGVTPATPVNSHRNNGLCIEGDDAFDLLAHLEAKIGWEPIGLAMEDYFSHEAAIPAILLRLRRGKPRLLTVGELANYFWKSRR